MRLSKAKPCGGGGSWIRSFLGGEGEAHPTSVYRKGDMRPNLMIKNSPFVGVCKKMGGDAGSSFSQDRQVRGGETAGREGEVASQSSSVGPHCSLFRPSEKKLGL